MTGKRLIITYGDAILYDDVPQNFSWSESDDGGIRMQAGPKRAGGLSDQQRKALEDSVRKVITNGLQKKSN